MALGQRQALSADNPWPGLDAFDEGDRKFFFGRTAETEELLRLVQREPLTVLFGRSGLGKTSLLKAGPFPRLREENYLPVYVRLDHAEQAPDPWDQIWRALGEARAVDRVEATARPANESLWAYFHRRDTEYWSERNRPITPVIALDQFEEIFTLGRKTQVSLMRSAAFLAELGDLIEHRPPEAIKHALETDPAQASVFDFKRSAIRLLVCLREDFLAEIEALRSSIPSLMYNRFRLAAMNGAQAYEVVTGAGGRLVDDEVARRIIRLAWKNEPSPPVDSADFPTIEVDPALLSVVCSELNLKRRQSKLPLDRITPDLLEGADREILTGFYERSMAGIAAATRAFVEDELITDRGYRDSYALEDALLSPGVAQQELDALIDRRLLRVDERQSVRRLELTHDVLTRVVKDSRDTRKAREAKDAADARERVALGQQRRNRRNSALILAAGGLVLILGILATGFWIKATDLLRDVHAMQLRVDADHLQQIAYDTSLLVSVEAIRANPVLDAQAALLRRFVSHPNLATFLSSHQDAVLGVAFSPDGKRLASASWDRTVIVWDLDTRNALATLEGHKDAVFGVAFSPDGRRLASASWDNTVIVWDVDTHQALATLEGHKDRVFAVTFSPDGKGLASASWDNTVIVWDVGTRKALARFEGHKDRVFGVAFSPDGKRLASASWDSTVIVWDVSTRKALARLEGHKDRVFGVAFSPDGKRLASASSDHTVIVWDMDTRKALTTLGHERAVNAVAFDPEGKRLASASSDRAVIMWDVGTRKALATLEGHKDRVFGVAFSPDGKRLASASSDRTVIVWDVDTHQALATLEGHKDAVFGVAFSPDRKRLASTSWDRTVIVWDVDTHKTLATLEGHKDKVFGVAFSPTGGRLASASWDHTVVVWDVDTRMALATLEGHKDRVFGVAFSPDGKRLASASSDHTVIVWDMDTRKALATLGGHKDAVLGVAFSPDGKLLASAGWDNTVIVWNVDTRKALVTLQGHKDAVFGVAFSPDGKRLASASLDRTVIVWDVDGDSLVAEACRTANRNLTCQEWRDYLGVSTPYRKTCKALPGPERCD
jgi:WD40 repeat protein